MKFKLLTLFGIAIIGFIGAGAVCKTDRFQALADETQEGMIELLQEDFYGNSVSVPVKYNGSEYLLADETRNIYVYDGTYATSPYDIYMGYRNFPMYSSQDGVFSDKMAITVYSNIIKTYDFYTEENIGVSWKGIKGNNDDVEGNWALKREVPIYIFLHLNNFNPQTDTMGMKYNAAFNYVPYVGLGFMMVGDGGTDGVLYQQGKALDIIAHEYQHGISAAMNFGLGDSYDSGALNEAVSDIFGMLIEGKDFSDDDFWGMGEDGREHLGTPLRSAKYAYPSKVSQRLNTNQDNGAVHENSMIFSHFQYTAWELMPEYFTKERIGHLWFKALDLITKNSQLSVSNNGYKIFSDCMQKAAKDLKFSEEAQQVIQYSLYLNEFKVDKLNGEPMYKVQFVTEDGTVLGNSYVKKGEKATAPSVMKPSSDNKRYEFLGWDQDFSEVNSDMIITAKFQEIPRVKVEYFDSQGNLLSSGYEGEGEDFIPEVPELDSTPEFDFHFVEWEESFDTDGTLKRTAKYDQIRRKYTVCLIHNGEPNSLTLEYGEPIPLPPQGYEGWFLDVNCLRPALESVVTGDITLYARAASIPPQTPAEEETSFPFWAIGVSAAIILLAGGTVILITRKRKKKDASRNKR